MTPEEMKQYEHLNNEYSKFSESKPQLGSISNQNSYTNDEYCQGHEPRCPQCGKKLMPFNNRPMFIGGLQNQAYFNHG